MVQIAVRESGSAPSFAQGRSMRNSPATLALRWKDQRVTVDGTLTKIITTLEGSVGLIVEHHVEHISGKGYLTLHSAVKNVGNDPITVDALSSFSIGGITPYDGADAPNRLRLHRFRSAWSAEARPEVLTFEQLGLENSWTGFIPRCERFGVVGSAPLNGFVPLAAVEDTAAGVIWAACVEAVGTWQMEVYRKKDEAAFSGGLGDREFGHWWKVLAPGDSFISPRAWVTVTAEALPTAWDRLLQMYSEIENPASEADLPVIFNEWCTSWGNPTHANLLALTRRLEGSGVRHIVIDDGWAERPPEANCQSNGDWNLNREAFPEGIKAVVDAQRAQGFDAGIWFEFEVVNPGSQAWGNTEHLLHRDERVLEVGTRRFWDFRDPWVHRYLGIKVRTFLKQNGLHYLKVDYNETIGFGIDGAESPGEGLRQHLEGVVAFFRHLRDEIPELVIENCSSGGHRHSAPFLRVCAMSSFSDAHETPDIPIITANLLPVVPRSKLQVWAVLRKTDDARRLYYSLAATFLGRMCLSGDVHELSVDQWAIVQRAINLYRALAPSLNEDTYQRFGPVVSSYNHPEGWQAVVRNTATTCLVVAHTFAKAPAQISVPLPPGTWKTGDTYSEPGTNMRNENGHVMWKQPSDFSGAVWVFQAK